MTRGASPWSDPVVESGFSAAYAPVQERDRVPAGDDAPVGDPVPPYDEQLPLPRAHDEPLPAADPRPLPTLQDELDEAADRSARPLTRTGRRARAPQPARLSPARAVAGAAVSVSGVLLGIATLLWISDDPADRPGPVVSAPPAAAVGTVPEAEEKPVDPEPVEAVAAPPAAPPVQAAPSPAAAPSVVVPVTVLNNSRVAGLADRAAERFEAGGWPVRATGNFRGRIPSTTVYYEPGQEASARELARRFDGIVRVRPRFETLPARGLVVVVTRDFAR